MKKNWHFIMSIAFLMGSLSFLNAEESNVISEPSASTDATANIIKNDVQKETTNTFILTNEATSDDAIADDELDQEEEIAPTEKETVLDWDRTKPKEPTPPNSCSCSKKKEMTGPSTSDDEEDDDSEE
jgi:hypothetical protein